MEQRFESSLSRTWDQYDAYLFDIDGTLLTNDDAVHYFAFCQALEILSGLPIKLDGVAVHGNTDLGILRDALSLHGVAPSTWRPLQAEAVDRMERYVVEHKQDLRVRLLPGAGDVLMHLRKRGAALGVATGNLQSIGESKLEAAGILGFFTCGSYSDQDEYRQDVFQRALLSVRRKVGVNSRICILGDTPADIRAARNLGVDNIAVSTVIYTVEQLESESPNRCCSFLADLLA